MPMWHRRIHCIILAWALVAALGPATCVQLAGWCSMLANNIAERPWRDAVQRTFDGKHPCAMCHTAASMRDDADAGGRRAPAPEPVLTQIHLALAEAVRWEPPDPLQHARLPGWMVMRPGRHVRPDPEEPVPRS